MKTGVDRRIDLWFVLVSQGKARLIAWRSGPRCRSPPLLGNRQPPSLLLPSPRYPFPLPSRNCSILQIEADSARPAARDSCRIIVNSICTNIYHPTFNFAWRVTEAITLINPQLLNQLFLKKNYQRLLSLRFSYASLPSTYVLSCCAGPNARGLRTCLCRHFEAISNKNLEGIHHTWPTSIARRSGGWRGG